MKCSALTRLSIWPGLTTYPNQLWPEQLSTSRLAHEEHPAGGRGLWGTSREVPSFLYAMPLPDGRVFLEETCLVAKPALPFATLKRRLHRRLAAMNVQVRHPG